MLHIYLLQKDRYSKFAGLFFIETCSSLRSQKAMLNWCSYFSPHFSQPFSLELPHLADFLILTCLTIFPTTSLLHFNSFPRRSLPILWLKMSAYKTSMFVFLPWTSPQVLDMQPLIQHLHFNYLTKIFWTPTVCQALVSALGIHDWPDQKKKNSLPL